MKIDYYSGDVLKEIPFQKVLDANPDIDIFGFRQSDTPKGSRWVGDRWHSNDIDFLPEGL